MKIIKWKSGNEEDIQRIKALDEEFDFIPSNEELFIIFKEEILMGYALVQMGEIPNLKRIFIKKEYRNCGYGTKLLRYTLNWMKDNKLDVMMVKDHKNSNNFLERMKFVRENGLYIRGGISYKKAKEEKSMLVIILNLFINIILASLRMVFGYFGRSTAMVADGVNSLTDCVSNTIAIIGLKAGNKPEDEDHPFGHGKMESIMSIIIGTLIIIAAVNMLVENFMKLIKGEIIQVPPKFLIWISILSLLIKAGQYLYIKKSGEKLKSFLLIALSKDYKADFIISTSIIAGIFLSIYINPIIDPILGILVILYILKEGYGIIKDSAMELLDTQDTEFLEEIYQNVMEIEGIENAHDFHMSKSGEDIYLFMDVRVDKKMNVEDAHELTHVISKSIKLKYKSVKNVIVHVEPMY